MVFPRISSKFIWSHLVTPSDSYPSAVFPTAEIVAVCETSSKNDQLIMIDY